MSTGLPTEMLGQVLVWSVTAEEREGARERAARRIFEERCILTRVIEMRERQNRKQRWNYTTCMHGNEKIPRLL